MGAAYNKAKKIIEENEDLVDDFGGASDNIVKKLRQFLICSFPKITNFFYLVLVL